MKYKVTITYINYKVKEKIFDEEDYRRCEKYTLGATKDDNVVWVETIEYNDITDKILASVNSSQVKNIEIDGNAYCKKCGYKIEGGYCECFNK